MTLKARLAAGEKLIGTFLKTPSPILVEVLGTCGLDLLCLDAEHAPFDRSSIDACILAARACGLPVIVRTPTSAAEHILNALDCGADGVLLPHIRSAAEAEAAVAAATYRPGGRGYAGSSRAARYGLAAMSEHRDDAAARTVVIAQIEDVDAVAAVEVIAAIPGLDALFVGRIDLTVALDAASPDAPEVVAAVDRIIAAGAAAGVPVGMFVPRNADVAGWHAKGASLFLQGSDHAFLRSGAAALLAACRG
ncbi:HpcH/HpaI aldolase/citrate lyase family protein [uncultured Sphingomonas sp.]|uniref:HpcH/HpaI aldolase family protein n=1 Tax=uncultured Sphingomonas sp. TaxID=158754 RepID=UPI0035C9B13D